MKISVLRWRDFVTMKLPFNLVTNNNELSGHIWGRVRAFTTSDMSKISYLNKKLFFSFLP